MDQSFTETLYFDGEGKKIEYDEEGNYHSYFYDNNGNLIREQISPDNAKEKDESDLTLYTTQYEYDYIGNLLKTNDARNFETIYRYDDLGRLVEVEDAKGQTMKYKYNNLGKVIQIENENQILSQSQYDELGRLIKSVDPLNNQEYTKYDKIGNPILNIDKNGTTTSFIYDNRNRVIKETIVNEDNTIQQIREYEYIIGADEDKTIITEDNFQTTLIYYKDGSLKKKITPDLKEILYQYYNNGSRKSITDYFGKITEYIYDSRNRLK
uniref:RHS repeat protein n=1 Tax=Sporosalibacterium faouarense TaxID=516123 RepID=UPI00192BF1C2